MYTIKKNLQRFTFPHSLSIFVGILGCNKQAPLAAVRMKNNFVHIYFIYYFICFGSFYFNICKITWCACIHLQRCADQLPGIYFELFLL